VHWLSNIYLLVGLLVYSAPARELISGSEIPGFGHPNPGIFGIKIRNKNVVINPV